MSGDTSLTKTVVFDVGMVLIEWDPRHLYRKLFADNTMMEAFLAEVCTPQWNEQQDAGRTFAAGVQALIGEYPDQAELITAYHQRWEEMVPGAIQGTVDILEALARRSVPLYALTNFSAEKFALTRARFSFFEHFSGIVVSGEVGKIKPDPGIFLHLCERYSLTPSECVFIDDSALNVAAARRCGLHAIQFQSASQLASALREMAIL